MDANVVILMKTIESQLRHANFTKLTLPDTVEDHLDALDHWFRQKRIRVSMIILTPLETDEGLRGGIIAVTKMPFPLAVPSMMPLLHCHRCKAQFNRPLAVAETRQMAEGLPAFCPNCAAVSTFRVDLSLAEPTPEDFEKFIEFPEWADWKSQAESLALRNLIVDAISISEDEIN